MGDGFKQTVIKWVQKVFKNENFEEFNFEFPDYDTGGGLSGEITFVKVTCDRKGSKEIFDLIIKKSKDDFTDFGDVHFKDLYVNEVNFYSKFVPHFQNFLKEKELEPFENLPRCYGTIIEKNQFVIILENLKPKGFRVHDIKEPLDLIHIKLVLAAYANWHALSFALRDQDPQTFEEFGTCNKGMIETNALKLFTEYMHKEIKFVIEIYEKKNKKSIVEKLNKLREEYDDLSKSIFSNKNEDYLVIKHGDNWNNNFLFHYAEGEINPDKAIIIDWQHASLGSPVTDLVLFLFYGSSKKELAYLDDLLAFYYETLAKKLTELGSDAERCFPREIFLRTFRKYAPIGIGIMPGLVKMSCKKVNDFQMDFDLQGEKDFTKVLDGELRDPDEYFNRIDGVLEFCIEHGFM